MRGRKYLPKERAAAVALARIEGDHRAARILQIDNSTLRGWTGSIRPGPPGHSHRSPAKVDEQDVAQVSEQVAEGLDVVLDRLVTRLKEASARVPIETAKDLRDVSVAFGITTEKRMFLRGGPTARIFSVHALVAMSREAVVNVDAVDGDAVDAGDGALGER